MKPTKDKQLATIRENHNTTNCYSIADVKRIAIGHFFDKSSMRFFNSVITQDVFPGVENVYFVTSEKFDYKSKRFFTVRKLDIKNRSIETVGDFQGFSSIAQAKSEAIRIAYLEKIGMKK